MVSKDELNDSKPVNRVDKEAEPFTLDSSIYDAVVAFTTPVNPLPFPTNEPVKEPVTPPLTFNEPVTSKLPDIIAEPVYGKGSVSIGKPFCNRSPITLSEPDTIAEPVYGNGSVSIAAPFCNRSPTTLSEPDIIAEPVYGNGSVSIPVNCEPSP